MTNWTSGYMADVTYTYGYFPELNPLRAKLPMLFKGLICPTFKNACELGFGQGVSTNFHATATDINWYGTDFNPSQAGFARELATASNNGAILFDESFAEFCRRKDLPQFDFIGLHGIWSWVSDENRKVIVDFIRRKLNVGGVLYISYNTLPGWSGFAPVRQILTQHAEKIGAEGRGIISKIEGSLGFAKQLFATNPNYVKANPGIADRLEKLQKQDGAYLAHEYFNGNWDPMYFSQISNWLTEAKLTYACSAYYPDHLDGINLTKEQSDFLNGIPDPILKESVRDFIINQQFRRDYWVRGARQLTLLEKTELFLSQKIVFTSVMSELELKITGVLGEAQMTPEIYEPVLEALSDHRPKFVSEVWKSVSKKNINLNQLMEAVMMLAGRGYLTIAQSDEESEACVNYVKALNKHLKNRARYSGDITMLASPITGGGIPVGRFQQLFIDAINQGKKSPEEWAIHSWNILKSQGQAIIKDGKALNEEQNLAEIREKAEEFNIKLLPVYEVLKIVD